MLMLFISTECVSRELSTSHINLKCDDMLVLQYVCGLFLLIGGQRKSVTHKVSSYKIIKLLATEQQYSYEVSVLLDHILTEREKDIMSLRLG